MEMQNHKKTNQSGHGVHVCHKCGWSFPNPHPSAKHRRAHKKICGTIQGYKLGAALTTSSATTDPEEDVSNMDSTVSVAEHDSDSDLKTPCSKIVEKTVNSSPSIISSRSEDDLFSDAITDFARSPGVEEEVTDRVRVMEPAKLVRKIDYGQPEEHQLNVENTTTTPDAGNLCPMSNLVHGKQQQADQVSENEEEPVEGRMLSEKQMPSSTTLPVLHKEEEAVIGENVKQSSDAVLLDTDTKESKVTLKDSPAQDEMPSDKTGRGLGALSAAEELNGEPTDLQSVDPVMEVTEKQSISLEPHHDSTSHVSKDEKIDVCVHPEQVMGHSEGKVGLPTDMDERYDTKISVDENLHSSVVSDDSPLEEYPTFAGKGYKDHKSDTSGIPVPDTAPVVERVGHEDHVPEEVRAVEFVGIKEDHVPKEVRSVDSRGHKEDYVPEEVRAVEFVGIKEDHGLKEVRSVDSGGHKEDYVPEEVRAVECVGHKEDHVLKEVRSVDSVENKEDYVTKGSHSISPIEPCQNVISINSPSNDDISSNIHLVEEKLEQKSEQIKLTVAEVSMDDAQARGLETKAPVVCESSVMEVGSGLNGSGTKPKQTVRFLEELNSVVPDILAEDFSRNGKSFDVRVDGNNKQEFHSVKDDVADFDDKAKEHGIVIHENHDSKSTEKAAPLAITALSESADATPSQVSQTTNSPRGYDAVNHDEVGPQIVNSNANAERSGLDEENQSIDSKRSSECEFHTLELHGGMETKKELQVNDLGDHVDTVSDLGESGQLSNRTESQCLLNNLSVLQDDAEELKVSDNKMVEVERNYEFDTSAAAAAQVGSAELTRKETVYMDAVSSFKSSDAVDDNKKELDTGTSIVADSDLVGNDKNLIEQNCASVTDALADTASQTDSMEGHWGSISVLSDAPNVNETDPLPTIDSQAAEVSSLKPKATASDQQIDRSNALEPPISTMSGEPNITVEPQGGSCEIQTLENSAALQSGGLQSITHVSTDSPRKGPNEEIIAKVNSWSSGSGKQHTPLKNLLGEAYDNSRANSPNIKKDVSVTNNGAPVEDAAKARAEAEKEWNSPARYPANIERKKGKVKSKQYWVPLFCCSSSIHSN